VTRIEPVRVYVDAWDPGYGSGLDPTERGPAAESTAQLDTGVELPADSWRPLAPAADLRAPGTVLLVDGVRRTDARIWIEEADGTLHPGVAASCAAGVVRCDLRRGLAELAVPPRIDRVLVTSGPGATDLVSGPTGGLVSGLTGGPVPGLTGGPVRYRLHRVTATEPAQLAAAVQQVLHELEVEISTGARLSTVDDDDLLVLDGPLRGRSHLARALGYVKSHRVEYLPPELSTVVGRLRPGQRCPVFLLGTSWHRYSWYLKLPGPPGSPWAGVVRVEASAELPRAEVIRLADRATLTLPRFASVAYKDPRAPQNLVPVAGLERRLRAMLGHPQVLLRALRQATTAGSTDAVA
jgi:hypothetical protein